MKTIIYTFIILSIGLIYSSGIYGQVGENRMDNGGDYWIFGLNGGAAWQDSDVNARLGGGWGFYLGHSIKNKPNAFFSTDARLRYLNSTTFGQNATDNRFGNADLGDTLGYNLDTVNFAHNHKTEFHDLSVEMRVNFEELRRKQRIMLSLYGGLGLGIYGTKFDQLDKFKEKYNYENINFTRSDNAIKGDIIEMRDGDYETNAYSEADGGNDFKVAFMPSIGAELGYWFTPNFALGIGHRTTFTLQDNFNGLTDLGKKNKESIHHYTSLMLHWRIPDKEKEIECPDIQFQLPTTNNEIYNTSNPSVYVFAKINNVNQSQITYLVNGNESNNFSYDSGTDEFNSSVQLLEGENTIVIQATNKCGTDGQNITVIYTPNDPNVEQPPIVTITNPVNNPLTTTESTINLAAQILYIQGRNNVIFKHNGIILHAFSYSGNTFQALNIVLTEGQNTFTIQGINEDGSDIKTIIINYEKNVPDPLPVVNITSPLTSPYTVNTTSVSVSATILNVESRNNISFSINGKPSGNFSFSGTSFNANNILLDDGANTIVITGMNTAGQDSKSTIIIYKEVVLEQPPVVTITTPIQNPYTTQSSSINISASILNVASKNDIVFTVNGQPNNNFYFSGSSFYINNLNLITGNNTLVITGTNTSGSANASTIIIYRPIIELEPTVIITSPSNNFATFSKKIDVTATIQNVNTINGVTFKVNGQINTNFSFNGNSFVANNIVLNYGNNTFEIIGSNSTGQASKAINVIFKKEVVIPKPTLEITAPSNNSNTSIKTTTITATIEHVKFKSGITFKINGIINSTFILSGNAFIANNVKLNHGKNTFEITAKNSSGQVTKSIMVTYKKPVIVQKPTVIINNPNQNPFLCYTEKITIEATITNITKKSDIDFEVNGQKLNNFNLNGTTFEAENIVMNIGNNTISITATNSAGQDSKSTLVISRYSPPPTPKEEEEEEEIDKKMDKKTIKEKNKETSQNKKGENKSNQKAKKPN
ncbi:MAG: hypothetical protein MK207_11165 [Saprospiraceae bacterium]|nr:hypothetical protein [Saprospiraceae bacterium]